MITIKLINSLLSLESLTTWPNSSQELKTKPRFKSTQLNLNPSKTKIRVALKLIRVITKLRATQLLLDGVGKGSYANPKRRALNAS